MFLLSARLPVLGAAIMNDFRIRIEICDIASAG